MFWLSSAAVLVGYLLGSLPTAYLAARTATAGADDIRLTGDGNVGAGNIGRILGRRWGVFVGAVDIAKGAAAVLVINSLANIVAPGDPERAGNLTGLTVPGAVAGFSAIAGHVWPVWLRFRGGRGAATAIGVTLAAITGPVLIMALPTLALLWFTRSTTLAVAFIYLSSIFVARVAFDASWVTIGCCVAVFVSVGVVHFWTLRSRANPSAESVPVG